MIDLKDFATVVGIDPGLSGAVVRLERGEVKVETKFKVLRDISRACQKLVPGAARVIIEFVHAMPGEGVSSVFSFGSSTGTAKGSVYCLHDFEPVEVAPQTWQGYFRRKFGLPKGTTFKELTCEVAAKVFPSQKALFWGPRGGRNHGTADASLIAAWGALNPLERGVQP